MCLETTGNQVISKKRVVDHGEVLTGKREVNAMLDLVKSETERIDSRFLEPACGTGNFLTEILDEVEELENEADVVAPVLGQALVVERAELNTVDSDFP